MLGLQIYRGRVTKEDFNGILDRVNSKLTSRKGRLLNKLDRVTLANAVLSMLSAHGMQLHWFPQSICDQLDRMCGTSSEKAIPIVECIWLGGTKSRNQGVKVVWDFILLDTKTLFCLERWCGIYGW